MIAYTKLNLLTSPAAFGPWLLRIVQRRAVLMQKQRRMQALQSDIVAAIPDRSPGWIHRYEDVIEQIAKLPGHERIVVVVRYVNQYPVQRIAASDPPTMEMNNPVGVSITLATLCAAAKIPALTRKNTVTTVAKRASEGSFALPGPVLDVINNTSPS